MPHLQIDGLSCKKVCLTLKITPRFRRFPKDIIVPSNVATWGWATHVGKLQWSLRCSATNTWVCLKMLCTPKPNGFADHYPVFKWLFHWGYTPFSDIPTFFDAFPSLFDAGDLTPRDIARRTPAVVSTLPRMPKQRQVDGPGRWKPVDRNPAGRSEAIFLPVPWSSQNHLRINGVWHGMMLYAINQYWASIFLRMDT